MERKRLESLPIIKGREESEDDELKRRKIRVGKSNTCCRKNKRKMEATSDRKNEENTPSKKPTQGHSGVNLNGGK